jgi:hypothetical protein
MLNFGAPRVSLRFQGCFVACVGGRAVCVRAVSCAVVAAPSAGGCSAGGCSTAAFAAAAVAVRAAASSLLRQQCLYFLPEPQAQGSFLPGMGMASRVPPRPPTVLRLRPVVQQRGRSPCRNAWNCPIPGQGTCCLAMRGISSLRAGTWLAELWPATRTSRARRGDPAGNARDRGPQDDGYGRSRMSS